VERPGGLMRSAMPRRALPRAGTILIILAAGLATTLAAALATGPAALADGPAALADGPAALATGTARAPAARPAETPAAKPAAAPPARSARTRGQIRHVIEIMLENHTFENLFGPRLAGGGGRSRLSAVSAPLNEGDVQGGIHNSRAAEFEAMDARPGVGFLMDRYGLPPFGISAVTSFGPWADPNLRYLARNYEYAVRNFQPAVGPTKPNVMMALNGTAHGWYFNRRNPHPTAWYSIFDELTRYGRTWKVYLALPSRSKRGMSWRKLIPPGHGADVTTAGHFFGDLSAGHLPSFAFVRPGFGYSEEPREDIGEGDAWLGQLVSAVARSRYWRSSAIFITYDEGGGFWDPVPPPFSSGYGTRTPLVIVSPWARHGVFRQRSTNIGILSFMQRLWGMPALTPLNAQQNALAAAFDLRQRPLPRPRPPVCPHDTIGFHGPTLTSRVRTAHPHHWLRLYLDAQTGGLALDQGMSGRLRLSVVAPATVRAHARFPALTRLVAGRAMVKVRFPAAGYYRVRAAGPHGSVGWTTVVVLRRASRASRATEGLPRTGF
jgi:phospholipase C